MVAYRKSLLTALCLMMATQVQAETLIPASEIRIRDPFIVPHAESGLYYMYAQIHNRDESLPAGVEVYWSKDLKQWAGPETVFAVPEGFWGPRTVWAPEVHAYKGKFYLFATFHPAHPDFVDDMKQKGTQVLVADSPRGPFKPFANRPHTPPEWMSLDGTLYVEDGQPWMIFCHEWGQVKDGTMERVKLKDDLSGVAGEPVTLFKASEAPWSKPIGSNKDGYVTDGPFLFQSRSGKLIMIWSTIGKAYNVGMAVSESGKVAGPWRQLDPPLVEEDGGHGMIFRSFEGELLLAIHQPNRGPLERLHLVKLRDAGDRLEVVGGGGVSPHIASHSDNMCGPPSPSVDLKEGFANTPPEARPRFYWFWLGGSMTREGIRADLEAMHDVGIGGVLMMNAYPTPPLDITCMGDTWWDLLTYANTEAKRQGILFGTHNCPGWSTSGGPWNSVENSMQKVVFSEQTVEGPGAKALTLARPEVDPTWDYYRDITVLAVKNAKANPVPKADIVDLSAQMDAEGSLEWDVPEGTWTVFRFGHTTTGHMNGPPIKGGQGLECDKMSREATRIHFEGYAQKIIDRLRPLVGETFHNFELDSYEAGKQNWTPKFREEFEKRRGYDPMHWLPVLAGCTLGSTDQTARFKWDMEKTISDLYVENHYQYLAELAREQGVGMDYEAYGGPFDPLAAGGAADMPMGEGWTGSGGWSTVKLAVSAAHTHGRPLIGCEALTSTPMLSQWKQTPYSLKAFADQAFYMGINMMVLHCYAQQPWEHVRPGMTMNFWGTHFSRTQTWWDLSRPWFDYLARCQFLLQRGMPVVDVCILGTTAVGGIPAGTKSDFCNDETLSRMTVENGDLVLPACPAKLGERSGDGMRYRLLLLPDNRQIPLQSLKEIERLVNAGAAIAGPRPHRVPGLTNYPEQDHALQELAGTIWGNCDGNTVKEARYEKGHVFWGLPVSEALARLGISPDVTFQEDRSGEGVPAGTPATGIEFNHRSSEGAEIYFISNQEDCYREVVASFRVSGKQPSFWYPDTGTVEPVPVYEERDGRVSIPLRLSPSDSLFVVFQDTAGDDHLTRITRTPGKNSRAAATLQPLRIAKATTRSKDKKTFVDLTENVQALARTGTLHISPDVFRQLTSDLTDVEIISIDYLVEDDRHTRYAHPNGTLQIPQGVPLSRDVDCEITTTEGGKASLSVWQPGTYTVQWASGKSREITVDAVETSVPLDKDWTVSFKPGLGAPESVHLPELHSLSAHEIPGVKYYSGISTYEKHFLVPDQLLDPAKVTRLDLGQVKSVAEVMLNGRNLGILWKPPFRMDVTGILRAGENHLQVKIANNWPNRMIGDEQEPDDCNWSHIISWPHGDQPEPVGRSLAGIPDWVINKTPRPSTGRVTFSTWKFFDKDTPLLDSGLLGAVRIDTAHRFTLEPDL